MNRARVDGGELDYELRGDGDLVVFVHHGAGADWFQPLFSEPILIDRFRLLRYHRPGYAGSSPLVGELSFTREAATLRELMRYLGARRAHVVGHSASACIALQMALDVPGSVHSLSLMEPALRDVPSPPEVPQALGLYQAGDRAGAVETFLRGTCGPHSREVLETTMPDAINRAVADSGTFFGHELPALRQWSFGPDEARRITQPVLAVLGEASDSRFHERHRLVLSWLPHAEPFVLPGAGHLLHLENRSAFANGLADFLERHAIEAV
jgi:pimeloyl-ACP methyl ester carboxylesterase